MQRAGLLLFVHLSVLRLVGSVQVNFTFYFLCVILGTFSKREREIERPMYAHKKYTDIKQKRDEKR